MINVKTQLMFQGKAKEAIDLYSSIFKEFNVGSIVHYGEGEEMSAGAFKLAEASFAGHDLLIFNSPPVHDFSFTPSMSIVVDFDTIEELRCALLNFKNEYNRSWLCQKHKHKPPNQVREDYFQYQKVA